MKKIFYSVPVLLAIVFAACKSDSKEEQKVVPAAVTAPANTTTPATNTTFSQDANPVVAQPPVVVQPNTTPVNIQAPTTRTTAAAGMNPAHGEPGHRCDIPVGSPLNSPAAKTPTVTTTTTAPAQQTVAVPQIVTTPPAAKVAPGMNPAHGEPGHRCDIAVGAPLNSPPSVAKPTGANTPVSIAPEVKKQ